MNEILRQPKLWWLVGWLVVKFLLKGIKKRMYGLYAGIHICKTIQQQQRVNLILTCDGVNISMKRRGQNILLLLHIHT